MKNHQTVDNARQATASLEKSELEAKTVKELRQMATDVATGRIEREDGSSVLVSAARKSELVNAIYSACTTIRLARLQEALELQEQENALQAQLDTAKAQEEAVQEEIEYNLGTVHKKDLTELAESSLTQLVAYTTSKWNADGYFELRDQQHVEMCNEIVSNLKMMQAGRNYAPKSEVNHKTFLLNMMRKMASLLSCPPQVKHEVLRELTDARTPTVIAYLHAAYKHQENESRIQQKQNFTKRAVSSGSIKVAELVKWARTQLTRTDATWSETTIALALVTGRRVSELLSSGQFFGVAEKPYSAMFDGQLKTKKRTDVVMYEIPLLAPFAEVKTALARLEEKRVDSPVMVNDRYSKSLSKQVKKLTKYVEGDMEFKIHKMRQIYAQIQTSRFAGDVSDVQKSVYLSSILGHADDVLGSTHKSYQCDFMIGDLEKCIELM